MAESEKIDLLLCCENGTLFEYVKAYIEKCDKENKFPNVAGFCCEYFIGQSELERLSGSFPNEYDVFCSFFEDEALNSDIAVTLVGAYMKKRLGYGDEKKTSCDSPPTVVFEHDIIHDGE